MTSQARKVHIKPQGVEQALRTTHEGRPPVMNKGRCQKCVMARYASNVLQGVAWNASLVLQKQSKTVVIIRELKGDV